MAKRFFGFLTWIPTTAMAGMLFLYSGLTADVKTAIDNQIRIESGIKEEQPFGLPLVNEDREIVLSRFNFKGDFAIVRSEKIGNPNGIIGVGEVVESDQETVLKLNRRLIMGEWLYVNFYEDDGDGIFDENNDILQVNKAGKSFLKFQVSGGINE